ncbi:MAG: metallophosphoesterase [Acidimicrobiia bacterium]
MPDVVTLIQMTDLHLRAGGRKLYGSLDTTAQFHEALESVVADHDRIDALLLTGDLADRGEVDAYRDLRARCDEFVAHTGAIVIGTVGNHDDRAAYREGFLGVAPTSEPVIDVVDIDGLRVVALDSVVPHHVYGEIDDAQLDWLADVLRQPAERATVLALHHSPIPERQSFLDLMGLREPERLGKVLAGSDVALVVAGHVHHSLMGSLGGVPVVSAPAIAYETEIGRGELTLRVLPTTGYCRITAHGKEVTVSAGLCRVDRTALFEATFTEESWRDTVLNPH